MAPRKDRELRQEVIEKLSVMKSGEATDFFMEILNK
ncbi:MAG: hypothetical protein M2R45_05161 [Verrucomicrobia subdivision 3 bacterium]|nr:hypothetical protein [Limisphaerales bacterium]MCS1413804.1 hypothetical protein [Limisphaerales bacterium]